MELRIREAKQADAHYLYLLANDPLTRNNSFNSKPIDWEDHVIWFEKALNDPNRYIFIANQDSNNVGVVKFETKSETVIGITVDPKFRGRGLAASIIRNGCLKFWEYQGNDIIAYIKLSNIASIKSFVNAHFSRIENTMINGFECQKLIAIKK
ncbi:MAG: GNAT family N-acetyltransferase [Bacteroidales bacterium]|nr:GNAT family N-acetyltransferase [Bacteroidales bacterium]